MDQVFDVLRNFFPGFVFHVLKYDNANLVLLENVIFKRFLLSSDAQSCLTLSEAMDYSTLGLPVHHQLPELTQTHVHRLVTP